MGPSIRIDGEAGQSWISITRPKLQWGRRFASTERVRESKGQSRPQGMLQWGRRFASTESRVVPTPTGRESFSLQWGRRFASTERAPGGRYKQLGTCTL